MTNPNQQDQQSRPPTLGERFDNFFKKNPVPVLLISSASVVTAISTLVAAVGVVALWYKNRDWKEGEYARLRNLRAGYTYEKFEEQLGRPSYRAIQDVRLPSLPGSPGLPTISGKIIESVFQRRGYWVDTKSDSSGTVFAYAVTACQEDFRPTFPVENGSGPKSSRIVLNQSVMSEAYGSSTGTLKIFTPDGTTINYVFETEDPSDASGFRGYAWGLNDECQNWRDKKGKYPNWNDWYASHARGGTTPQHNGILTPDFSALNKNGRDLASRSVINTYAETANYTSWDIYPDQIGVSRLVGQ
ncbi:hypothetical protein EDD90_2734 [Streptomyces sp. Ag109_O5-1]|uniref:ETEC_3214 domain-containing protein n=1 Tax=Streptomyces sp. Ag109_O5-1 TaxID=1938851 RepID=UPI000F511012|nr:ETEC_3214 domain-containing protein [Streptomyces sp. Ag109_O5-1]RPE39717.1 hypothetical protein EDD90_2734 [Streptomyces sp. Ag109_O5-1]